MSVLMSLTCRSVMDKRADTPMAVVKVRAAVNEKRILVVFSYVVEVDILK